MGYRCPNCGQDFGNDKEKLYEHFENNPKCHSEAFVCTELWKVSVGLKKPKIRYGGRGESRQKRTVSRVSPNHVWVKQNVVTNDDGSDTMVCARCGLTAKRYGEQMVFDMRYYRKIENCIDNPELLEEGGDK